MRIIKNVDYWAFVFGIFGWKFEKMNTSIGLLIFIFLHQFDLCVYAFKYLLHFNMHIALIYATKLDSLSNIKINYECSVDDHVFVWILHNRFHAMYKWMLLPCKYIVYLLWKRSASHIHFLICDFLHTCNRHGLVNDYPLSKWYT